MYPTPTAGSGPKRDNSTIALLSLYLLLLAFFILLNSISQREHTRTAAAIGSLDATFSAKKPMAFDLDSQTTETATKSHPDTFQIRLLQIFQTELPLARYEVVERGSVMRIILPADNLFARNSANVRPSRVSVLDGIADALQSDVKNVRREVEFMVGVGEAMPAVETATGALFVSRAGAFARALINRGVPQNRVRAGLLPGNDGHVQLTFYVRARNHAVIDFGREEPGR